MSVLVIIGMCGLWWVMMCLFVRFDSRNLLVSGRNVSLVCNVDLLCVCCRYSVSMNMVL